METPTKLYPVFKTADCDMPHCSRMSLVILDATLNHRTSSRLPSRCILLQARNFALLFCSRPLPIHDVHLTQYWQHYTSWKLLAQDRQLYTIRSVDKTQHLIRDLTAKYMWLLVGLHGFTIDVILYAVISVAIL